MNIKAAFDEWYLRKGKLDSDERGFKLGPSSLADCLRKQAWLMIGAEPEALSPAQVRLFELGHQRGDALEAAAKEIWPGAISQFPVRIPLGRFWMDGTADLWIPSLRTVVDFKTAGSYSYSKLDEEGVSQEYKLQIHAYRDGIAASEGLEARDIRAVMIYESKDSGWKPKPFRGGDMREIEVPWTVDLEEAYQVRLLELEELLLRNEKGELDPTKVPELPLGPRGGKSWKCKYCSIGEQRGHCYEALEPYD